MGAGIWLHAWLLLCMCRWLVCQMALSRGTDRCWLLVHLIGRGVTVISYRLAEGGGGLWCMEGPAMQIWTEIEECELASDVQEVATGLSGLVWIGSVPLLREDAYCIRQTNITKFSSQQQEASMIDFIQEE
ncbi:hypothetical protein BD769DRAFT_1393676 [Suillus cothurnatus]|nr:hypothetical protein BD769DRAFT_1393676 [Suillus cothurnatus]